MLFIVNIFCTYIPHMEGKAMLQTPYLPYMEGKADFSFVANIPQSPVYAPTLKMTTAFQKSPQMMMIQKVSKWV